MNICWPAVWSLSKSILGGIAIILVAAFIWIAPSVTLGSYNYPFLALLWALSPFIIGAALVAIDEYKKQAKYLCKIKKEKK